MGRPREVSDQAILAAACRCFLEKGAAVPATVIAAAVGVSHTTLFNRFGSKQGLLIAALGPPKVLPWKALVDAGPDERPIPEQFVEIGLAATLHFRRISPGLAILRAAGMSSGEMFAGCDEPSPLQARRALHGWLERAVTAGRIAACDPVHLTQMILGALNGRVFHDRVLDRQNVAAEDEAFVRHFADTLWRGLDPRRRERGA